MIPGAGSVAGRARTRLRRGQLKVADVRLLRALRYDTVALYLNRLQPDDVFRATATGEVVPQKSMYFVPKIPTGLGIPGRGPGVKA